MREIILDTETTGLDFHADRVIEIGAVELVNRFPTGRTFHAFINPQGRRIHAEALAIHGISAAHLADKPSFHGIADEFLAFIESATLVAHNATFDTAFINAEFVRLGHPAIEAERVIDTLAIARRKHPMGPNSLDALCRRYGVDNSRRTTHGALLDCELLSDVYIELIGGKQASLVLETAAGAAVERAEEVAAARDVGRRPRRLPARLTEAELAAHAALVADIGECAIWTKIAR